MGRCIGSVRVLMELHDTKTGLKIFVLDVLSSQFTLYSFIAFLWYSNNNDLERWVFV